MKRTLVIALGTPAVAALFLLAGGSPAANAGEQHHPKQHCAVAPKCRPAPLPKPPGGWPCKPNCDKRHHRPICPPKPPHTKPPGTGHHGHNGHHGHHRPPFVAHPVPPIVHHKVTVAAPAPAQLPRTGSNVLELVLTSGALIGGGVGFKRLSKVGA